MHQSERIMGAHLLVLCFETLIFDISYDRVSYFNYLGDV